MVGSKERLTTYCDVLVGKTKQKKRGAGIISNAHSIKYEKWLVFLHVKYFLPLWLHNFDLSKKEMARVKVVGSKERSNSHISNFRRERCAMAAHAQRLIGVGYQIWWVKNQDLQNRNGRAPVHRNKIWNKIFKFKNLNKLKNKLRYDDGPDNVHHTFFGPPPPTMMGCYQNRATKLRTPYVHASLPNLNT